MHQPSELTVAARRTAASALEDYRLYVTVELDQRKGAFSRVPPPAARLTISANAI